jgi:hypothetical protein
LDWKKWKPSQHIFHCQETRALGEKPGLLLLFLLVVFLAFLLLVFAAAIGSVVCPITGTMLHLEIQEGREGMKDESCNKDLGTTAGCTVRLMEVCSTYIGIKGDAWFGSLTAVSELALCLFEAVMQVKQNHGLYPKKVIKDALKESSEWYTLPLKRYPP